MILMGQFPASLQDALSGRAHQTLCGWLERLKKYYSHSAGSLFLGFSFVSAQ
jgi:hypothetical protein